jgi:hypothetical protein
LCTKIDNQPDGTSILERIYAGVNVYYNYTGTVDCFDLNDDPHGMDGWDWQVLQLKLYAVSIHWIYLILPLNGQKNIYILGQREYMFRYLSYLI